MQPQLTSEVADELAIQLPESAFDGNLAISCALLRDVSAQAADGLFKLKKVGLEVGGVLFGAVQDGTIRTCAARPFQPQYAFGPSFHLSGEDSDRLRDLIRSAASDRELDGATAVGYYVSHTRTEPVLSDSNLALFGDVFPEKWQVVLVVKPYKLRPTRCVIYYRTASGLVEASQEFDIDHREGPPVEEPIEPVGPAPVPTGEAPPALARQDSGRPERRHRRNWTIPLAACLFLAAAAVAAWFVREPRVAPVSNHIDRLSEPVRQPEPAPLPDKPAATVEKTARVGPPGDGRVKELEEEVAHLRTQLTQHTPSIETKVHNPRVFIPVPLARNTHVATPDLSTAAGAPPQVEATGHPALPSALEAGAQVPALPAPVIPAPAPTKVARKLASGRILWTGNLRKGGLLFIEDSRPSSGAVVGGLPGHAVRVAVQPAELTEGGILVYAADAKRAGTSESPGAENGWNRTAFAYDPKRLADVTVIESPAVQNNWRKLVVRANRPLGLLMISWQETASE